MNALDAQQSGSHLVAHLKAQCAVTLSKLEIFFEAMTKETLSRNIKLNETLDGIAHKAVAIEKALHSEKILYTMQHEKDYINKHFRDFSQKDVRIYNLLRGLDAEEAYKVILLIKRISRIMTSNLPLDLYTEEEKVYVAQINKFYYSNILELEDDVFAFKNKFLPVNRFFVSIFNSQHGLHALQSHTLENINQGTILDVGGYAGDSCLLFRDFFPDSYIYSFECLPENIWLFHKTIELNDLKNIEIIEKALSDTIGRSYFKRSTSASFLTSVSDEDTLTVATDTLDNFLQNTPIEKITLIKVDIEGAELEFLAGARKTIEQHRPVLLLSMYHSWNDFLSIKPVIESWDLNYSFKIESPKDKTILMDTLLVCEPL